MAIIYVYQIFFGISPKSVNYQIFYPDHCIAQRRIIPKAYQLEKYILAFKSGFPKLALPPDPFSCLNIVSAFKDQFPFFYHLRFSRAEGNKFIPLSAEADFKILMDIRQVMSPQ